MIARRLTENSYFLQEKNDNTKTRICPHCGERKKLYTITGNNIPFIYIECNYEYYGRFIINNLETDMIQRHHQVTDENILNFIKNKS